MVYYRKKRFTRKPRKATKADKNIRAIVRKEISRNLENKTIQYRAEKISMVSYNNSTFGSKIFPISPYTGYCQIDQGLSQSERIGNSIKIKNATLKFIMNPKPYDATWNPLPEPMEVIMWLFYDKWNNTSLPSPTTDFIQNGGSSTSLSSNLMDTLKKVNTDRWRLLTKRTFKLGYSNSTGQGVSTSQPFAQNNDFKLNIKRSVNFTKYLVKNVKYNDNNSVPSTRGLFAMFEAVPADGNTGGISQESCEISYQINLDYEDA